MFKRLLLVTTICLSIYVVKAYGQTDYILQGVSSGDIQFMPPNDPIYTVGVDFGPGNRDSMSVLFWRLPPVLIPGMLCKVVVKWKFWTDHFPVFYMNYFGDWQPYTELARSSMYGGIPSPNEEFIDTFNFTVPSTPGWYRIRFMARGWYDPVTSFYGTPSALPKWYSELVFHSGYPIGAVEENNGGQINSMVKPTNMPNPFRTNTTITYIIPKEANVVIKIYDKTGRLVNEIAQGNKSSGSHSFVWNGKDNKGNDLPAGDYFYTVEADKEVIVNKASLVK